MIKHNVSGIWNVFSVMRNAWITECLIFEPLPDIKHGFYFADYKKRTLCSTFPMISDFLITLVFIHSAHVALVKHHIMIIATKLF
jgi:hypothetical protein